ncbi:hypothetical protein LWE61_12920 [Sphingobium sufflavum]|uniref:hypothetical protein n=1 Tax=Sphingobium sufflavum TaxID=1129547 RepID=UPI001F3B2C47|nr:hypothetical protein [Sphingobium sufflavum]MCE7797457.1 hypothetical protein [Sphingobium sufflavum]
MLEATFNERLGVIQTVARGMTPPEELDLYVQELRRLRDRERTRGKRFLHLVDAREAAVQSQWASERLNRHTSSDGSIQLQDRTAVVVNSALVKMQVARLTGHTQYASFTDMDAAIAWLTATAD